MQTSVSEIFWVILNLSKVPRLQKECEEFILYNFNTFSLNVHFYFWP